MDGWIDSLERSKKKEEEEKKKKKFTTRQEEELGIWLLRSLVDGGMEEEAMEMEGVR
jgi:hypothetical protein